MRGRGATGDVLSLCIQSVYSVTVKGLLRDVSIQYVEMDGF